MLYCVGFCAKIDTEHDVETGEGSEPEPTIVIGSDILDNNDITVEKTDD